jgi:hypothetical protein
MAEPTLVNAAAVVVTFDSWANGVATLIAGVAGSSIATLDGHGNNGAHGHPFNGLPRLAVLVTSRCETDGASADEVTARIAASRSRFDASGITHFTVERDGRSIWIGPTVVAHRSACHSCWEARRRQHADALARGDAVTPPADQARPAMANDSALVSFGAKATLAVVRRVLASPGPEAGIVRRFRPGGGPPDIGRVVKVSGCSRCESPPAFPSGWSLRSLAPVVLANQSLERR